MRPIGKRTKQAFEIRKKKTKLRGKKSHNCWTGGGNDCGCPARGGEIISSR